MNAPKVLVSSIDVWNNTSGSDTFPNLLSGYHSENVANIYIRSGVPTSAVAGRYFHIDESSVLRSIFFKKENTGYEIRKSQEAETGTMIQESAAKERARYAFFSKHRFWFLLLMREAAWKLGKWKSQELDDFIDDFKPDLLLFPIESYIHFNRINNYLIEKTKAPAIAYMWDDNFSYKGHKNVGFLINRFLVRKSIKKILGKVDQVLSISPKMQNELYEEYGINSILLTKGTTVCKSVNEDHNINFPLKLFYTGKLSYGRLNTIQMVSEVVNEINQKDVVIEFDIYSGTKLTERELASLELKGVYFKGSVTQDKVPRVQQSADMLLLAEALSGKHMYDARLSFSTKLVDYLASGKAILAVGRADIASIEYLKENDTALVATSRDELLQILKYETDCETIKKYGKRAQQLAEKKHNLYKVQDTLYKAFYALCDCSQK